MNPWIFLSLAIIAEVIATTSMKASENFTRPGPTALVVAGYAIAFYFLSLTLKSLPIGIAYAVWSGVGIALITLGTDFYAELGSSEAANEFNRPVLEVEIK